MGRTALYLLPWVLSIAYVLAVAVLPAVVNSGYCKMTHGSWEYLCQLLPTEGLTEFDKWGSYLSGALVPLSLLWVGMAFRLQQRQLAEQGRQQAETAQSVYEAQKITDRQTLISMSDTYIQRMETSLQDLAELIDSNAPASADHICGRTLVRGQPTTIRDAGRVFNHFHNLLIAIERGTIAEKDVRATKALFVDSDISDYLDAFFGVYNEFQRRCEALECLVLMPPDIAGLAHGLKYSILRSTCRWHPDEKERNRLKYLIGWTDAQLLELYAHRPQDGQLEPFDTEEYYG